MNKCRTVTLFHIFEYSHTCVRVPITDPLAIECKMHLKIFKTSHNRLRPGRGGRISSVTRCRATVLLTRELGKNDKMHHGLNRLGIECMELPLIEHTDGVDR